jgi:hypothetical protein
MEEQRNVKFVQIIEYEVCSDHFIHRHFYKLAIWLLWCERAGDMISHIACHLLHVASCFGVNSAYHPVIRRFCLSY